jgi:putative NIF3 family GTP cyclohydrolase 1 type 2
MIPYEIDLYLTGETSLYLLEYAQHHELSVAVYSHNYTELPGVQMLAERLCQSLRLEMMGHLGDSHF